MDASLLSLANLYTNSHKRLEQKRHTLFTLSICFQVIKRFPESLQADVCLHLHRGLFEECGVFKTASEGCLRALALRFKIRHYLPGHYIIKQGDEVKRLYFIAKGNIEVVKHDETMLTLGWYFANMFFFLTAPKLRVT